MKRGGPIQRKASKPSRPRDTGPTTAMRKAVLLRDDATCQRCGRTIDGRPYSLQHRLPRGRGGTNTLCNLVTVCGSATSQGGCHDWMENEARHRAKQEGWLVPNGKTPEDWPVLRFGQEWEMPGESWVECEPHPMQVEMGDAA